MWCSSMVNQPTACHGWQRPFAGRCGRERLTGCRGRYRFWHWQALLLLLPLAAGAADPHERIVAVASDAALTAPAPDALSATPAPTISPLPARDFAALLPDLLADHIKLQVAEAEYQAARERARIALGKWFPELSFTASLGIQRERDRDMRSDFNEMSLKLTQRLADFGATDAAVEKARLTLRDKGLALQYEQQKLLADAAEVYINLVHGAEVVALAIDYQTLAQRRYDLEQFQLQQGFGSSTALVQAKTDLAAAEAKRLRHEGKLQQVNNQFRELFGFEPQVPAALQPLTTAIGYQLPTSLERLLEQVWQGNIELLREEVKVAKAQHDIDKANADGYRPTLELIVEAGHENNIAGSDNIKQDYSAKVELRMPFNLGNTAANEVRAAHFDLTAQQAKRDQVRDRVEKGARDAWQRYTTSTAVSESVREQVAFAVNYEALLREEQQLGSRSELEVLAAAGATISARIELAVAQIDQLADALAIYQVAGLLAPPLFDSAAAVTLE